MTFDEWKEDPTLTQAVIENAEEGKAVDLKPIRRKSFDCEVKAVEGEDRTLEFVISSDARDRDNEVISPEGWNLKNYKKNPVVLWAHDYHGLPIAKTKKIWVEDGKLIAKAQFPTAEEYGFADQVYRLYKGGYLRMTSVGFIGHKWEDGDGEKTPRRRWLEQELLEFSGVPVGSNPEALGRAVTKGVITESDAGEAEDMKTALMALWEIAKEATKEERVEVKADTEVIEGDDETPKEVEPETKPGFEETENEIRYRIRDPKLYGKCRTIALQKAPKPRVNAIYCQRKDNSDKWENQALRFPKEDDWTIPKAQAWVKEHPDAVKWVVFDFGDRVFCGVMHEGTAFIGSQDQTWDTLSYTGWANGDSWVDVRVGEPDTPSAADRLKALEDTVKEMAEDIEDLEAEIEGLKKDIDTLETKEEETEQLETKADENPSYLLEVLSEKFEATASQMVSVQDQD